VPRAFHVAGWILLAGALAAPSTARAATHLTATTGTGKIVVAAADGSSRQTLGNGLDSFVSPNGAWVAVIDADETSAGAQNFRLQLYATAGGAPRVLAIWCQGVSWSPDSTKLACVDHGPLTSGTRSLLVIDAASAAATTVATGHFDSRVSFSPDSARIAYVQNTREFSNKGGALKTMDLASHATKTLRQHAAAPVWGPHAIALSTVKPGGPAGSTLDVAVFKADGTRFRRLTHFHPRFFQTGLSPVDWSANGKRLLAALGGQDTFEAYAVDPKRGGARRIRASVTPCALSGNGRFVIGGDNTEASYDAARSNVVRVPWGGGKARVLLRHAGSPSFNG